MGLRCLFDTFWTMPKLIGLLMYFDTFANTDWSDNCTNATNVNSAWELFRSKLIDVT